MPDIRLSSADPDGGCPRLSAVPQFHTEIVAVRIGFLPVIVHQLFRRTTELDVIPAVFHDGDGINGVIRFHLIIDLRIVLNGDFLSHPVAAYPEVYRDPSACGMTAHEAVTATGLQCRKNGFQRIFFRPDTGDAGIFRGEGAVFQRDAAPSGMIVGNMKQLIEKFS